MDIEFVAWKNPSRSRNNPIPREKTACLGGNVSPRSCMFGDDPNIDDGGHPLCSTAPLMRMLRGAFASGSRRSPWHQSVDVSSQGDGKQVDSIACLTLRFFRRYYSMHEKTSLRTSAAPKSGRG